jgi:hypothetical protein
MIWFDNSCKAGVVFFIMKFPSLSSPKHLCKKKVNKPPNDTNPAMNARQFYRRRKYLDHGKGFYKA